MSTNNNAQMASNTTDCRIIPSYCKNVIKMIGLMFLFIAIVLCVNELDLMGVSLPCQSKNNVVIFSFDSILAAMALTKVFWVMAVAILVSGGMMMYLADKVSEFLNKIKLNKKIFKIDKILRLK